jgi:hypothetical protein
MNTNLEKAQSRMEDAIKKRLRECSQGPDSGRVPRQCRNPGVCPMLTQWTGATPSQCFFLCGVSR